MSNPPLFLECISAAKDVIIAGAAVATASIAYSGLNKWRAEIRGRADFETARRLTLATYQLRDALRQARSPLILAQEFPEGYHEHFGAKKSDEEEADAWRHVYSNRWAPVMKVVQELDAAALEAEAAMWPGNVRETVDALRVCASDLFGAMESMIENAACGGRIFGSSPDHALTTRQRLSSSVSGDDNPMNSQIVAAVADIENLLRPHLVRGR